MYPMNSLAEAEGDLNAAEFRASHLEFWTRVGETVTEDTLVVTVYFNLLQGIKRSSDQ